MHGTVRDAGGAAVVSALISLSARSSLGTFANATTLSDTRGEFEFARVAVGDASVTASEAGTLLSGSASGAVTSDGDTLELALTLEPAGAIGARVLRESDLTPAAGMAVELAGGGIRRFAATGADGSFAFQDLAIHGYELSIDDPLGDGRVRFVVSDLAAGQTRDLGDLILDELPPQVLAIDPADGAANASPATDIRVVFRAARCGDGEHHDARGRECGGRRPWVMDAATWRLRELHCRLRRLRYVVCASAPACATVGHALPQEILSTFSTADRRPVITSPAPDAVNVDRVRHRVVSGTSIPRARRSC